MTSRKLLLATALVALTSCWRDNPPSAAAATTADGNPSAHPSAERSNTPTGQGQAGVTEQLCGTIVDRAAVKRRAEELGAQYEDVRAMCEAVPLMEPFLRQIYVEFFGVDKRDAIDDMASRLRGDTNFKLPELKPYFREVKWSGFDVLNQPKSRLFGPQCPLELGNAFYCAEDSNIYYDPVFLAELRARGRVALNPMATGDYTAMFVLAHEYGHAVSLRLNPKLSAKLSIARENMADCFGGAFTRVAVDNQLLRSPEARREALLSLVIASDREGYSVRLNDAHGDATIRTQWFNTGYTQGVVACRTAPELRPLMEGVEDRYNEVQKLLSQPTVK